MQTQPAIKKIKCVIVVQAMEVGGAEMDILRNFNAIQKDSLFDISICIFNHPGMLYEKLLKTGIKTYVGRNHKPLSTGKWHTAKIQVENMLFIKKIISKERPDIVHCFLPKAYLLGCMTRVLCGLSRTKPAWVMSRLSLNYYMKTHKFLGWFEKNVCHKYGGFSAFIANSKAIIKQLKEEGCSENKTKLIYNGIETKDFTRSRSLHNLSANPLKIIAVGNLHTYKGYDDLLDALAMLKKLKSPLPPWICEIAGKDIDDNLQKLQNKAHDLGLSKNIRFLGCVQNIQHFLKNGSLFVHPSHTEGLPNAIIEAMATELPIVATNVGGIPELIEHRTSGTLVPPCNPKQLMIGMRNYIENLDDAHAAASQAGQVARCKFDVDISAAKYKNFYAELLVGGN